jgi:hypothetical protein
MLPGFLALLGGVFFTVMLITTRSTDVGTYVGYLRLRRLLGAYAPITYGPSRLAGECDRTLHYPLQV